MAKYYSKKVADFWDMYRDSLDPLPYLGGFMKVTRYTDIQRNLTLRMPPITQHEKDDKGFYMRELVEAWNFNMYKLFLTSSKVSIDETILGWDNPSGYTQINRPRKPKEFGNEWITVACCQTNKIFRVDLCETKVRPTYLPRLLYTEELSTVSIVMRLTGGMKGSDRKVITDSGFSVLEVLHVLLTFVLYGMFIAKKRGSWPKGIPGDKIKAFMEDKPHFAVGTLKRAFNYNKDAVPGQKDLYILAFKDAQYTGICAATYGTVNRTGNRVYRYTNDKGYQIQYPIVYSDYYNKGRADVDINNNLRSNSMSIEEGHFTRSWEMRVHDFFVDLTVTNAVCANRVMYNNHQTIPNHQIF